MSDPNRDNMGQQHGSAHEANMANQLNVGEKGATGGFIGGASGAFLGVLLIVPKIIASIVAGLFALLFKAGIVGKFIQTAIVSTIIGIIPIAIAVPMLRSLQNNTDTSTSTLKTFGFIIALAVALLVCFWYWKRHYYTLKRLGTGGYIQLLTLCFAIAFYGTIAFVIVGFLAGWFNNWLFAAAGGYIAPIVSIIFYIIKINTFAWKKADEDEIAEKKSENKIAALVCIAAVSVISAFPLSWLVNWNLLSAESRAELDVEKAVITASEKATTETLNAFVIKDNSKIYLEASVTSSEIKILNNGDTVRITGEAIDKQAFNTYIPIEYEGTRGFMLASRLAVEGAMPVIIDNSATVTRNVEFLRDDDRKTKVSIPKGTVVKFIRQSGSDALVEYEGVQYWTKMNRIKR